MSFVLAAGKRRLEGGSDVAEPLSVAPPVVCGRALRHVERRGRRGGGGRKTMEFSDDDLAEDQEEEEEEFDEDDFDDDFDDDFI